MMNFMDAQYVKMQNKLLKYWEEMKEERGDSNFVSILLIIVIVVGVAVVFKKQIGDLVDTVWAKVNAFVAE